MSEPFRWENGAQSGVESRMSRLTTPRSRRRSTCSCQRGEDPPGHELATIQERVARIRDSMEIQDADGHRRAMVRDPAVVPVIAAAIILWGVLPVRLEGADLNAPIVFVAVGIRPRRPARSAASCGSDGPTVPAHS
jgi:hypothetical protein